MSRRPEWIGPRKAIPKAVKLEVWSRSKGMCQAEDCDRVGKDYDHIQAVALGGDNSADNVQLLCRQCHDAKTAGDVAATTKADRMGGRCGQYARRKAAKASSKHRPIKSPGFKANRTSKFKKKMDGSVVRRKERV